MAKIGVAFGSFDILHPGHLHFLKAASKYGKLTVVVARDATIKKIKGKAPLIDEKSRLEMVSALDFVDKATLGQSVLKQSDRYNILTIINPDYIVLGYDQKVDMNYLKLFLEVNGMRSKIIKLKPYKQKRFKSSKLKKLLSAY